MGFAGASLIAKRQCFASRPMAGGVTFAPENAWSSII